MHFPKIPTVTRNVIVVSFSALAAVTLLVGPAAAKTARTASAQVYDYQFMGTTGTVANSAPTGPALPLTLTGTWTNIATGVEFSGNTTGNESVAYGRPTSGSTLSATASQAVGFGAQIVYQAPTAGATCFSGTPNVTQIGKASATTATTQVKIQESNCGASKTQVFFECRIAGLSSSPTVKPVASQMPLVNGDTYDVSCVKSPDHTTAGTVTISLTVTDVTASQTLTNRFTQPAAGTLDTTSYISVANKYPLAVPAENTNQFNGGMNSTFYCVGGMTAVKSCISSSLSG